MSAQHTDGNCQPVLVVMGVSGSGKSTVARLLADALDWDLLEGDDLHPASNVAKMAAGQPLTDADRSPWLAAIAEWITEHTTSARPGIVTCSALTRRYRDVLRGGARGGAEVIFVHLTGTEEQIGTRLGRRTGHFMPSALLGTQLAALEPLGQDENAIVVDIAPAAADIAGRILAELGRRGSIGPMQADTIVSSTTND